MSKKLNEVMNKVNSNQAYVYGKLNEAWNH